MSIAALRWAREVRGISGTQKLVLWALADMANDYGECWPGAVTLAKDCCLSEKAVREAFDILEAVGLLTGERAKGRATRWRICIGATPEPRSATLAHRSTTSEPRSALPASGSTAHHAGTTFRTTPEPASGVPGNRVPETPEPRSGRTLKNPHITPREPPTARTKSPAVNVALPDWLPADAWADWCAHRKGKTWTQRAAELSLRQLAKLREDGSDPRAVIEQSIANGWRGLFPLRNRGAAQQPSKIAYLDAALFGAEIPMPHDSTPYYDLDMPAEEIR